MKIKSTITGFAVVLVVMSLIGGFGAFLRIFIMKTPELVDKHDVILQEHHHMLEQLIGKEKSD
jgi:hypothetical protein